MLAKLKSTKSSDRFPILMESVCNGDLRRPLHPNELLLPAILKWADWCEEDRKGNQLVFGSHPAINLLLESKVRFMTLHLINYLLNTSINKNCCYCLNRQSTPLKSMFDVNYLGPKGKSFRLCPFEFCQAQFTLLKDQKVIPVLKTIVLLGNEKHIRVHSQLFILFALVTESYRSGSVAP